MAKTNEQLYQALLCERQDLLNCHYVGIGKARWLRLQEVKYLIEAHEEGIDLTYAKLSYNPPAPLAHDWLYDLKVCTDLQTHLWEVLARGYRSGEVGP